MPKRKERDHPDIIKAAALAIVDTIGTRDNYAITRAAEVLNLPRQTVHSWLHRGNVNNDAQHIRQHRKEEIADRLEETVHRIIDVIPDKLATAPLNQLAVALGISIDKRLLLLGQPNSIQVGVHLTAEQRAKRLDEIFSKHLPDAQDVVVVPQSADDDAKNIKKAND